MANNVNPVLTLSTKYATCEQRRVPVPPLQGEFPRVLQIYVSFFSKIAPVASGVRLKTRFGEALALWLTVTQWKILT